MIHHTRGVYPDGTFKDNGVDSLLLPGHIWYNMKFRPGRALIVDGFCIHESSIGCNEEDIKSAIEATKEPKESDTAPYV